MTGHCGNSGAGDSSELLPNVVAWARQGAGLGAVQTALLEDRQLRGFQPLEGAGMCPDYGAPPPAHHQASVALLPVVSAVLSLACALGGPAF